MDIVANRRARLAALIATYESQAAFVRLSGQNQSEISGLLKSKSFGEKKARSIEETAGLPIGWLDLPAESAAADAAERKPRSQLVALMPARIKQRRKKLDLSQEQLATKAGIHPLALVEIELGKSNLYVSEIAAALEVSPDWLRYGNEFLGSPEGTDASEVAGRLRNSLANIPLERVSEVTGTSIEEVQAWLESGNPLGPSIQDAVKLQEAFRINSVWLLTGKGDPLVEASQATEIDGKTIPWRPKSVSSLILPSDRLPDPSNNANVHGAGMTRMIPVISWVQAGAWAKVMEVPDLSDVEEWIPVPAGGGPRCFALVVKGQSMFNRDGEPSFAEGNRIVVDPDREAMHKSLIIAQLTDEAEATFKQLIIEDGAKFLKALNPDWPNRIFKINGNASIGGVVIAKHVSYI